MTYGLMSLAFSKRGMTLTSPVPEPVAIMEPRGVEAATTSNRLLGYFRTTSFAPDSAAETTTVLSLDVLTIHCPDGEYLAAVTNGEAW